MDFAITFWGKAALKLRLKKGKEPSLKAFNPENSVSQVRIKTLPSSDLESQISDKRDLFQRPRNITF